MSTYFNTAFQDAVHCYNILKNSKECIIRIEYVKNDHLKEMIKHVTKELQSVDCNVQYAIFSIFKTFTYDLIKNSINTEMQEHTECEQIITRVLKALQKDFGFHNILDEASFNSFRENVINTNFSKFHTTLMNVSSLDQLKKDVMRRKTYITKDDGTLMTQKELNDMCNLNPNKTGCISQMKDYHNNINKIETQISEYTKCDKIRGGKKTKKTKRTRKQTRRRRHLRKHKK